MRNTLGTSENPVFEIRDRAFSCLCRLYHEYLILEFVSCLRRKNPLDISDISVSLIKSLFF